jgi:geranylgeranyl reductase family protein
VKFDVLVVGAGPAGSSCARKLSKAGLKVLLIEKSSLPRFKLCAGCLSARTLRLLPEGYERLILNHISSGLLGFRGKEYYEVPAYKEVAQIIDRKDFDYFLTLKAQEAGAELLEAELLGFEREGTSYKVFTSKGILRADFVVGADGFHSRTAKLLGYRKRKFFKSLEFFTKGELKDKVLIEVGWVKRGYLWVFPHGEGISVGIATTGEENLFELLRSYCEEKGIDFKKPKGWHIPFVEEERDLQLGRERVLLVGDAAGMTDPLLGEGIYYAIWGARLLASAILESPADPLPAYRKRLKPLVEELVYAGRIARLAYGFQKVAYRMGRGYALRSFYELLAGSKGYKSLYLKGWLSFLKHFAIEKFRL